MVGGGEVAGAGVEGRLWEVAVHQVFGSCDEGAFTGNGVPDGGSCVRMELRGLDIPQRAGS